MNEGSTVVQRPGRKRAKSGTGLVVQVEEEPEKSKEKKVDKGKSSTQKKKKNDIPVAENKKVQITAKKGTKKYRKEREAYLQANQKNRQADVTLESETGENLEKNSLEDDLDPSHFPLELGCDKPDSQATDRGAATPSWFQTPNQSDCEGVSSQSKFINNEQTAICSQELAEKGTADKAMTNKLSKKVMTKKKPSKKTKTKRKEHPSVLSERNKKDLTSKLTKLSRQQRKKQLQSSQESGSEDSNDETENEIFN